MVLSFLSHWIRHLQLQKSCAQLHMMMLSMLSSPWPMARGLDKSWNGPENGSNENILIYDQSKKTTYCQSKWSIPSTISKYYLDPLHLGLEVCPCSWYVVPTLCFHQLLVEHWKFQRYYHSPLSSLNFFSEIPITMKILMSIHVRWHEVRLPVTLLIHQFYFSFIQLHSWNKKGWFPLKKPPFLDMDKGAPR